MSYLGYSSEELERQFNPRAAVPDYAERIDGRAEFAAEVRTRLSCHLDVRFGVGVKETLDIFPAARAGAPVQLYIHGGYWRANDKSDMSFMAEPLVQAGACVVLANYDLCPDVTLDEIVAQARHAVAWCFQNIARYGGDPERLFISGSSAGGHLAAMALGHDWERDGLPADIIKGAVLITGVYNCEPVCHISINEQIRLDAEAARRNSPIHNLPRRALPLVIAVGGAETTEWIKMSRNYAERCAEIGIASEYIEVDGEDHFSLSGLLGDPDGVLVQEICAQMGLRVAGLSGKGFRP